MTKVHFLKVVDNQTKLVRITQTVQKHFEQNAAVLILAPNLEAAQYIDQLLWKYPEESFLPHAIAEGPTTERIAISTDSRNVNKATVLINLCPAVPANYHEFHTIYELYDQTHPSKEELSRQRHTFYQQNRIAVTSA